MQRKSDTEMWFVMSGIAILVTIAVFHRSEKNEVRKFSKKQSLVRVKVTGRERAIFLESP